MAVRGGGHSVPGFGTIDGGVVIDLSGMQDVDVDPSSERRARGGGATGGLQRRDARARPGDDRRDHLDHRRRRAHARRRYRLSRPRVRPLARQPRLRAEVVTADGTGTASEDENEDLFWAIRGGGGNFGVVTSLEFRLHPVTEVYGGPLFFELDDAATVLRPTASSSRCAGAVRRLPRVAVAPPLPFIPEDRHGETSSPSSPAGPEPIEEGEKCIKRLRDAAPVVAEHVGPMPYPALNSAFDGLVPPGAAALLEGELRRGAHRRGDRGAPRARPEGAGRELDHAHLPDQRRVPSCRVRRDRVRVPRRDVRTVIAGMWPDPADNEANIKWVRDYYDATAPLSEEGGYINFMSGDDQERIQANYKGNYDRLVEVKRTYDPDNLFHLNQNIRP